MDLISFYYKLFLRTTFEIASGPPHKELISANLTGKIQVAQTIITTMTTSSSFMIF